MRLTKSELEIMEVLWAADEPLCRADIIARSQDKTWKDSSVHILLNSMLKKEAIQEAGFVRRGKGYGRVFTPAILSHIHISEPTSLHLLNRKDSAQLSRLFAGLVKSDGVTPALLDELESMIQTRREELTK